VTIVKNVAARAVTERKQKQFNNKQERKQIEETQQQI
jgi:hypothetical protein